MIKDTFASTQSLFVTVRRNKAFESVRISIGIGFMCGSFTSLSLYGFVKGLELINSSFQREDVNIIKLIATLLLGFYFYKGRLKQLSTFLAALTPVVAITFLKGDNLLWSDVESLAEWFMVFILLVASYIIPFLKEDKVHSNSTHSLALTTLPEAPQTFRTESTRTQRFFMGFRSTIFVFMMFFLTYFLPSLFFQMPNREILRFGIGIGLTSALEGISLSIFRNIYTLSRLRGKSGLAKRWASLMYVYQIYSVFIRRSLLTSLGNPIYIVCGIILDGFRDIFWRATYVYRDSVLNWLIGIQCSPDYQALDLEARAVEVGNAMSVEVTGIISQFCFVDLILNKFSVFQHNSKDSTGPLPVYVALIVAVLVDTISVHFEENQNIPVHRTRKNLLSSEVLTQMIVCLIFQFILLDAFVHHVVFTNHFIAILYAVCVSICFVLYLITGWVKKDFSLLWVSDTAVPTAKTQNPQRRSSNLTETTGSSWCDGYFLTQFANHEVVWYQWIFTGKYAIEALHLKVHVYSWSTVVGSAINIIVQASGSIFVMILAVIPLIYIVAVLPWSGYFVYCGSYLILMTVFLFYGSFQCAFSGSRIVMNTRVLMYQIILLVVMCALNDCIVRFLHLSEWYCTSTLVFILPATQGTIMILLQVAHAVKYVKNGDRNDSIRSGIFMATVNISNSLRNKPGNLKAQRSFNSFKKIISKKSNRVFYISLIVGGSAFKYYLTYGVFYLCSQGNDGLRLFLSLLLLALGGLFNSLIRCKACSRMIHHERKNIETSKMEKLLENETRIQSWILMICQSGVYVISGLIMMTIESQTYFIVGWFALTLLVIIINSFMIQLDLAIIQLYWPKDCDKPTTLLNHFKSIWVSTSWYSLIMVSCTTMLEGFLSSLLASMSSYNSPITNSTRHLSPQLVFIFLCVIFSSTTINSVWSICIWHRQGLYSSTNVPALSPVAMMEILFAIFGYMLGDVSISAFV